MNAVPFGTLKMARGPEAAGVAATLADAMSVAGLATNADISQLRAEMNGRFTETGNRFGTARTDTNNRCGTAQS